MPNRNVVIQPFAALPGTVEIVGLGRVRQPRGGAQEMEIEVLVASCRAHDENLWDPRTLWLGCGQLDLLVPGSRWSGGRYVGSAPMSVEAGTYVLNRLESIGDWTQAPAGGRFPSRMIASAPGFRLRRADRHPTRSAAETGHRAPVGWILLPQMELLRGLFGVSSRFLLQLFDGIRNPALSPDRGLVDWQDSNLSGGGIVTLKAARPLADAEAIIAAAMVADPGLLRSHHSVHGGLSVNRAWRDGLPVRLDLAWPWSDSMPLVLQGRWIRRGRVARYFALRLVEVDLVLPVTRIEVHHPGAEAGNAKDLPPPEGRTRQTNAQVIVLTSSHPAAASRRPAEIPGSAMNIPAAAGIEIVAVASGGLVRRDLGGIGEDARETGRFSTADRQPGVDPAGGRAEVLRRRAGDSELPTRGLAEALDATWNGLDDACKASGWSLDAVPHSRIAARNSRHGGLDLESEPLVAVVTASGRRAVIVDMGSPLGDERSLGILVPVDNARPVRMLGKDAYGLCEKIVGRWRSDKLSSQSAFHIHAVNRPAAVWKSPEAYANLLGRRIASALRLQPGHGLDPPL